MPEVDYPPETLAGDFHLDSPRIQRAIKAYLAENPQVRAARVSGPTAPAHDVKRWEESFDGNDSPSPQNQRDNETLTGRLDDTEGGAMCTSPLPDSSNLVLL